MLSVALLLLVAQAPNGPSLRVLEGRVALAKVDGIERLTRTAETAWLGTRGYLESSATARLQLSWDSAASVELSGSTTLEWREASSERGGVYLELLRVERMQLEVRRGPLRCVLPDGWILCLEHGAAFVRRLPDGHFEIEHGAGAPLLVAREAAPGQVRPPWTVLPGAKVRLAAESLAGHRRVLAPTLTRSAPTDPVASPSVPWTSFRWPWNDEVAAPLRIDGGEGEMLAPQIAAPEDAPENAPENARDATVAPVPPGAPIGGAQPTPGAQATSSAPAGTEHSARALRLTPWGPRWSRRP